ncbi:MAG: 4Fe-4S binding protein [Peptostreptococcaceae bacterium]|nr:4Fe-4S binding protein [Peptostreptococcaceae bacterium]
MVWTINSKKIKINDDECNRCGLCVSVCPIDAMVLKDNNVLIDYKKCISCMRCANYCPENAIYYGDKKIIQKKVVGISEFNAK